MNRITSFAIICCFAFSSCQQSGSETPTTESAPSFSFDFEAIANQIAMQMALQEGERVFLLAKPGTFDPLISVLREKIAATGATDLGIISVDSIAPASWSTEFTKGAEGLDRPELIEYFDDVDLGIMMPGATAYDLAYAAMQDVLRRDKGRTVHFHWEGAYDLNGSLLEIDDKINAFYQNVLAETDYAALSQTQQAFESAMRNAVVRVTTPEGTDIRFEIGDRPVTKQDGDASAVRSESALNLIDREIELPAGAIRVAPIEETVHGVIAFPDGEWAGQPAKGVKMTFEKGKLTNFNVSEGQEAVFN
ncbi:MAG: hypothetical protein AAF570_18715, partial [Bacteroidota bacterium]